MRALLAALILTSCVSEDFDPDLTPFEQAAAQGAADEWNAVTTAKWRIDMIAPDRFTVVSGVEWRIQKVPGDDPNLQEPDAPDVRHVGRCSGPARTIYIMPHAALREAGDRKWTGAIAHEMGHAIGMNHTASGVMAPRANEAHLGPDDIAECRKEGRCEP